MFSFPQLPAKRSRSGRRLEGIQYHVDPPQQIPYYPAPPPLAGADTDGVEKGKTKAANFPASFLRIGTWERVGKNSNDLMSKCYFSRKRLVWEVLFEDTLKKKIEFPWSDIAALRTSFSDDGSGILDIALAKPPKFFMEPNQEAKKHTSWKECPDFTNNQATAHRHHHLEYYNGSEMKKTVLKLGRYDSRLQLLSRQQDSPYFSPQYSLFGQGDAGGAGVHDAVGFRADVNHGVATSLDSSSSSTLPYTMSAAPAESSGWGVSSYYHREQTLSSGNDAAGGGSADYYGDVMREGGLEMDEFSQSIYAIINSPDYVCIEAADHLGGATNPWAFGPVTYPPPPLPLPLPLPPAPLPLPLPLPPAAASLGGGCGGCGCPSDDNYHASHDAAAASSSQELAHVGYLLENDAGGGGVASSAMEDGLLQMIPKAAAAAAAAANSAASKRTERTNTEWMPRKIVKL